MRTALKTAVQQELERRDPVRWIESHFYIPETLDHRLTLQPYQRAVLREAYRRDKHGDFLYSIVVWSDIKKSIKSTIAAAVDLHRAALTPWGSVKVVANDLKQADSRQAYYIRRSIELNTAWSEQYVRKIKPSGYSIELANHAVIESIPVDPKGEAGGNDDLINFSELWAASQTAAQRMWTEMTLSPTKFGQSQRWVETYAGFSGESPLLEQLYQAGVHEGRRLDLSYTDTDGVHDLSDLEVYANDSARMLCLWNTRPRCPWQTPEYYAQEAAVLVPSEFDRVHCNQWGSSTQKFIPVEWWDGCRIDAPMPDAALVVALDAAVSGDCFGVAAVSRQGECQRVRLARKWVPPKGGKILFSNPLDPDDLETPEGYVRWLAKTYNVVEFAYDPYQLHDFATRLQREGVGWFNPFNQGADRLEADKALYDRIRDRRIQWSADADGMTDLREHLSNANQKAENERLRIVKRADALKIDLAVALSMASYEAARLNLG